MIGFGYSAEEGVLVVVACGPSIADSENESMLRQFERLDSGGAWRGRSVALIMVLDPSAPPPSVYWRKRFADHRWTWRSPQVFCSIVTASPVLRGVMTAMHWLRAEPAHVKTVHHATLAQATAWLGPLHGASPSLIRQLADTARTQTVSAHTG
jgi:hypothetical protein